MNNFSRVYNLASYGVFMLALSIVGCSTTKRINGSAQSSDNPVITDRMELVFQSGFEGTSRIIPGKGSDDDIVGKDDRFKDKSDWVADLDNSPKNGYFTFQYTGGDTTKRGVSLVRDPVNLKNTVLEFWIKDYWLASENTEKARVQANNYGIKPGLKEFYQSVRVFLDPDFNALKDYPQKLSWMTISEFWNNEWWTRPNNLGFRISLGIGKTKPGAGELTFILNAQDVGLKEIWNADSSMVKVPVGKWFTMDYYYKEGGRETGQFYMTIKPDGEEKKVVFDVTNFTHNTTDKKPDGLTDYNPLKMYTNKDVVAFMKARGKVLRIYWDDLKFWRGKN